MAREGYIAPIFANVHKCIIQLNSSRSTADLHTFTKKKEFFIRRPLEDRTKRLTRDGMDCLIKR